MYGLKGNFRFGMHDSMEREFTLTARLCGLEVVRQDSEIFGAVIPVGPERDRYARAVREGRRNGNKGGIVPDITVRNFPASDGALPCTRIYDVKTFGHKEEWYGTAGGAKPVEQRDATISAEYERLARAADVRHCGTPVGDDGPILHRLRELAPVYGLVIGANGEWSRGVDTFISDIAGVACANPERFGCCQGPEQARGVIAAMARDRLGRIALRGAAQVRIAALSAVTGVRGRGPGPHAHGHRLQGTQDEWDRVRDNTHVPYSRDT